MKSPYLYVYGDVVAIPHIHPFIDEDKEKSSQYPRLKGQSLMNLWYSRGLIGVGDYSFSQIISHWALDILNVEHASLGASYFSNVNPIPEPETYAMLLAGLGLVGFIAHRGKHTS